MAGDDRQIREAAEALLTGSLNSQLTGSLNAQPEVVLSDGIVAGSRQRRRISDVRRFFCLFVTFDLLLTSLMWLICTVIAGEDLKTAFVVQFLHYHIETSLFDIVMAAICRFILLLLFYAVLHFNTKAIVAFTTAASCAFLIAKVSFLDWTGTSQPVFRVLLIISSFILSWSEAWFFDFRVIPFEQEARNWFRYSGSRNEEREPLLRNNPIRSNLYPESGGTFFTPMDSMEHSEDEQENERLSVSEPSQSWIRSEEAFLNKPLPDLTKTKVNELNDVGNTTVKKSHELLTSPDWKEVSTTETGDLIYSMILPNGTKIMKITGVIDNVNGGRLLNALHDNIESSSSWNKHISTVKKVYAIDNNTDVIYQTTAPYAGGFIGARDFVMLRHRRQIGQYLISSAVSVNLPDIPRRKNYIRGENGVGCLATEILPEDNDSDASNPSLTEKCRFTMIVNTNLKGWIPQHILDTSLNFALVEFMQYLRTYVKNR